MTYLKGEKYSKKFFWKFIFSPECDIQRDSQDKVRSEDGDELHETEFLLNEKVADFLLKLNEGSWKTSFDVFNCKRQCLCIDQTTCKIVFLFWKL